MEKVYKATLIGMLVLCIFCIFVYYIYHYKSNEIGISNTSTPSEKKLCMKDTTNNAHTEIRHHVEFQKWLFSSDNNAIFWENSISTNFPDKTILQANILRIHPLGEISISRHLLEIIGGQASWKIKFDIDVLPGEYVGVLTFIPTYQKKVTSLPFAEYRQIFTYNLDTYAHVYEVSQKRLTIFLQDVQTILQMQHNDYQDAYQKNNIVGWVQNLQRRQKMWRDLCLEVEQYQKTSESRFFLAYATEIYALLNMLEDMEENATNMLYQKKPSLFCYPKFSDFQRRYLRMQHQFTYEKITLAQWLPQGSAPLLQAEIDHFLHDFPYTWLQDTNIISPIETPNGLDMSQPETPNSSQNPPLHTNIPSKPSPNKNIAIEFLPVLVELAQRTPQQNNATNFVMDSAEWFYQVLQASTPIFLYKVSEKEKLIYYEAILTLVKEWHGNVVQPSFGEKIAHIKGSLDGDSVRETMLQNVMSFWLPYHYLLQNPQENDNWEKELRTYSLQILLQQKQAVSFFQMYPEDVQDDFLALFQELCINMVACNSIKNEEYKEVLKKIENLIQELKKNLKHP